MGCSNFQLPNPNLPPAAALPASVLSRILHFAQLNQPLPAQQAIRFRFELVNKAWFQCSFRYTVVSLFSFQCTSSFFKTLLSLTKAARSRKGKTGAGLSGEYQTIDDLARKIKRLHVRWTGVSDSKELAVAVTLLRKVVNVECVELVVDEESWGEGGRLNALLAERLSSLERIKHFALSGPEEGGCAPEINTSFVCQVIPNWPKLESLTIKGFRTLYDDALSSIFRNSCALNSVTLHERGEGIFTLLNLVPELPASVRSLDINSDELYTNRKGLRPLVRDERSWAVARRLSSCALTDDPDTTALPSEEPRGQLSDFVLNLHNVEELIISSCALKNLGALEELKELRGVQVLRGCAAHEEEARSVVRMSEILELARGAPKIERVAVSLGFARYWGTKEMKAMLKAIESRVVFAFV